MTKFLSHFLEDKNWNTQWVFRKECCDHNEQEEVPPAPSPEKPPVGVSTPGSEQEARAAQTRIEAAKKTAAQEKIESVINELITPEFTTEEIIEHISVLETSIKDITKEQKGEITQAIQKLPSDIRSEVFFPNGQVDLRGLGAFLGLHHIVSEGQKYVDVKGALARKAANGKYYYADGKYASISTGYAISLSTTPEQENYFEQMERFKESFSIGETFITEGKKPEDTTIDVQNKESLNKALEHISTLKTPEEKKDYFRVLIRSIKEQGNDALAEKGIAKICECPMGPSGKCKKIDISDSVVAQYMGEWMQNTETRSLVNNILLTEKNGVSTFDDLGIKVLDKQTTLEQLLVDKNATHILVNGKKALSVNTEIGIKYRYIKENDELGDIVTIGKGTEIQIAEVPFTTKHEAGNISLETVLKQIAKNESISGRIDTQFMTASEEQKKLFDEDTLDFYKHHKEKYEQSRQHQSIAGNTQNNVVQLNTTVDVSEDEKEALSQDLIGLDISEDQILGRNSDGTVKIQATPNGEATFDYDQESHKAIVRSGSEGNNFEFTTDAQSKYPLQFFAQLAHHGNSDALNEQRGSQSIENSWRVSQHHLQDLFAADGTQYFREGQVAELANVLFHTGGKSIFDVIANMQIQDGDSSQSLAQNQMITPGSFAKNRNTILKFIENVGDRVITSDSILKSQQEHGGKIVMNKQGQLV